MTPDHRPSLMRYSAQRCLILPDVHQDIAWAERVFAQEATGGTPPDLVVFLGDYFDSHRSPEARATVTATCAWLDATRRRLGERGVFLLGNHDVQYLEARPACLAHRSPRALGTQCGSAFSLTTAKRIAKDLPAEFWHDTRLFVRVNGWLLSHAGLAPAHWPAAATIDESIARLDTRCREALASLAPDRPTDPLLQAGLVRGGDAEIGGITWLDWDCEFEDALPLPQIVAHTASHQGARQNGRSWCLDGAQGTYGVLTPEGLLVRQA